MRRPTRKVTWKVDRAKSSEIKLQPRPYVNDVELDPSLAEKISGGIEPGQLFFTNKHLSSHEHWMSAPSPHPYLVEAWSIQVTGPNKQSFVKSGALALYSGIIRVEELKNGVTIRVPRHVFIIENNRYIITNLNLLTPGF